MIDAPVTMFALEQELLAPLKAKGAELALMWDDGEWSLTWCDGYQSRTVSAPSLAGILAAFRDNPI